MVILEPYARGGRWPAGLAALSVLLLGLAALLMGGAGPAYRLDLLDLGQALGLLRQGAYVAIAAAGTAVLALCVAAWYRRPRPALIGGLVLVMVATLLVVPLQHLQRAQAVPPIHDITTDLDDPPAFIALVAPREAAPNAVGYPRAFAAQQRRAYPDLAPRIVDAPKPRILLTAETMMRERGWEIARVDDTTLEATASTTWFGFKDDVVLRLTESDAGVRVDMRSASRLGRSDLGTNALRIQEFLDALERQLLRNG
ncbi:DUF1499 domain-containing protein [Halomonas sp. 328]|uniref:DUF1499 domain-containing protein n=1 Tax=Halomonas sp. 328 TaxID=2776704 RepID=UPI0018A7A0DF|nr:DUF1499 domain-containing protein [Halomonas sp. 328]MBF8221932.1 DUF1499 domain-containing protein [Halomonas sp. 328]